MQIIPLSAVPSQSLQIILEDQECDIEVLTRGDHLFLNLTVDGELVQAGALCLNQVSIIQIPNCEFYGHLMFVDMLGDSNPHYSQLGDRYLLTYWSEDEEYAPSSKNPMDGE